MYKIKTTYCYLIKKTSKKHIIMLIQAISYIKMIEKTIVAVGTDSES